MIGFLLDLPGKLKLWLAVAGGVIVAVGTAYLRGRSAGKDAAKAAARKRNEIAVKKARKIESDVEKLGPDELNKRLSRWLRD